MTRIIIAGSKGRMGQALLSSAARFPDLQVVAQVDLGDDLGQVIAGADVVIDFSFHEATAGFVGYCQQQRKPMVIGTTGHTAQEKQHIAQASASIPLVLSSNFSTGVNVLFWLTRKAAEILGPGFDLEVVEMHHRLKKDAPSGTAVSLAQILAEVRQANLAEVARHGRAGLVGERTATEIGVHSVRGGDVVGDHTVIFAGMGERVELTHRASNRETFANGALRAARWVCHQSPGLYTMADVLGLDQA